MKVLDKEEKAVYEAFMKTIKIKKVHQVGHKSCMAVKPPKGFKGW